MPLVTLENYIVTAETRLAVGVVKTQRNAAGVFEKLASHGDAQWIPRSVCDGGSILEVGDTDIVVQEWFADKEGLDY